MKSERYSKGEAALAEVTKADGAAVVASLADVCPELGEYIVEFAYGDVISRPCLSLRERELSTIAMLGALGDCAPQLEVHIHGCLNVGCTKVEIVETLLQLCVYAGFPRAINAVKVAQRVFAQV
jgi:4-carboxymuconolactone decarboxylase